MHTCPPEMKKRLDGSQGVSMETFSDVFVGKGDVVTVDLWTSQ